MRSISPKLVIVNFNKLYKVSKYWSIIDRKIGFVELLNRMHAAQPAIKISEVKMSRRREYQP